MYDKSLEEIPEIKDNPKRQVIEVGDKIVPYEVMADFISNIPESHLPQKFEVIKDIEDTKSNLKNVMTDDEIEEIREQLTEIERNL